MINTSVGQVGNLRPIVNRPGLVKKIERSRRYRLTRKGYSICVVFLKLFERIYAPLTAGFFNPFLETPSSNRSDDHNSIGSTSGLQTTSNENEIPLRRET